VNIPGVHVCGACEHIGTDDAWVKFSLVFTCGV
jgi:hypothetical protein